jgi:hypothetical protein
MAKTTAEIGAHGSDDAALADLSDYESPKEYADQGDTRVVKDLMFAYTVETVDQAGNSTVTSRDAPRDTELQIAQIGLLNLKKGEENGSFYTSDELDNMTRTGSPNPTPGGDADISSMGEIELAEWLKTGKDGGAFTVDEIMEAVGNDRDLANRMLAAENIASDGDPRKGLEAGLTRVVEQQ